MNTRETSVEDLRPGDAVVLWMMGDPDSHKQVCTVISTSTPDHPRFETVQITFLADGQVLTVDWWTKRKVDLVVPS